jgi:GntR family histidine utilization transcriptional repressor
VARVIRETRGSKISTQRTLHARILADIEKRIVSGKWPPGHKLPAEVELAEQYGCARMTVNKVMTQLAEAGLIDRQRKAGSFVAQPRGQSAVLEITDIETEVKSLGRTYGFALQSRETMVANASHLQAWDVAAGSRIIKIACIHFSGDQPFCVEERLINATVVPSALEADFSSTAPGRWLLNQVPWTEAEHRIQAGAASAPMARRLDLEKGAPCLIIERRTWSNVGPVTKVLLTYPAKTHMIVARFAPSRQKSA